MKHSIYPCLWFDNQAAEAAQFYTSIFDDARVLESTPLVTTFELEDTRFMTLNGGPYYKPTPGVSYYVYCESEGKLRRLYEALAEGGTIQIPLASYPWSDLYVWVSDRYGISWQLDVTGAENGVRIAPCFLFGNEKNGLVREARDFYLSVFPDSAVRMESPFPEEAGFPEGTLLFTQFSLKENIFNAMSSSDMALDYDFSEANSLVVNCTTQEEIDYYWEKLTQGGEESQCGWLKDRYGISWQIVPVNLGELLQDPDTGEAVSRALLKMKKIDLPSLLAAKAIPAR